MSFAAPRKRFGQHFLHDRGVIERIVNAFDPRPEQLIVEIGPGRGALTLPLLQRVPAIHAIELDRDIAAQLPQLARAYGELTIHQKDALYFDFRKLADNRRLRVIGNLPYNISTPLLFHLLDQADVIDDMVFMVQKEVADRLTAHPGNKDYSRLSVMIQSRLATRHLFDVGPGAFNPPPKVHSSVVRLQPLAAAPVPAKDVERFAAVVKAAFGQRRKTLRNSLKKVVDETIYTKTGIDPSRRPETLTIAEFAALAGD